MMAVETQTRVVRNGNEFLSTKHLANWEPSPSAWRPLIHPQADEVAREVDGYFLKHWNFPSEKARQTFLNAGFSRVTCLYFPLAKDDRIHFACRLLTILFLIDGIIKLCNMLVRRSVLMDLSDILEHMSFSEGEAYNEKLFPIMRGNGLPDRKLATTIEISIYHVRPLGEHANPR
jgi:aristolochene synthase